MHAVDIMQTAFYMCYKGKFDEIMKLDELDILSFFFSALIHDYKHPGFNNAYMINTLSDIAFRYNGIYLNYLL